MDAPHNCPVELAGRDSITLVLPALNEQDAIETAIAEAVSALESVTDDFEIIVVDDGSSDRTTEIVLAEAQRDSRVRLIRHEQNRGYGAALQSGFAAARKELAAFTDADCQFDLHELDRLVLLSRSYDLVCGYRIDRQDSWLRRMYSKGYNLLVRLLLGTGVRDVDCALKMFRRSQLPAMRPEGQGFLVNAEMLTHARRAGLSVVEVGVTHRPRQLGASTVSVRHAPAVLSALLRFWWNEVAFSPTAVRRSAAAEGEGRPERRALPALVMLLAALLLYVNLGYPLIDRDETRYAEIPREMLVRGDWIAPHLNFQPYYDKPPLLYWLCAASYRLAGVSERSARLVSSTAAFLTIAATWWFGRRMLGPRPALIGALVLTLSAGFLLCGRLLLIDSLLTLCVSLSLFAAHEAVRSGELRWRWWLLAAASCGLGVLAKGPVACVLLAPPVAAFAWLGRTSAAPPARLRWRHGAAFAAVVLLLVGPWFAAMALRDSHFAYEFLYRHHLARFAGAFHEKPFWFYLPVLLAGGLPWTMLCLPWVRFLTDASPAARAGRPQPLGFVLLWAAWCIAFFSCSKCKLPTYILPAAPALALAVGCFLDQAMRASPDSEMHRRACVRAPLVAALTTCAVMIVLVAVAHALGLGGAASLAAGLACWSLALGAVLFGRAAFRVSGRGWALASLLALAALVQGTQAWLPALGRKHAVLPPDAASSGGPSQHLLTGLLSDSHQAVASYGKELGSFPFYLRRSDIRHFPIGELEQLSAFVAARHRAVLLLHPRRDAKQLQAALPPGTRLVPLGQRGPAAAYLAELPRPSEQTARLLTPPTPATNQR